jgi:hypothetical protein
MSAPGGSGWPAGGEILYVASSTVWLVVAEGRAACVGQRDIVVFFFFSFVFLFIISPFSFLFLFLFYS